MRDINELYAVCKQELEDIGIHPKEVETLHVARLVNSDGMCSVTDDDDWVITINQTELNDKVDIKDSKRVMCHELLHTLPGCLDHGPKWREYAKRVDKAYGYGLMEIREASSYARRNKPTLLRLDCPLCGSYTNVKIETYLKAIEDEPPVCEFCGGKIKISMPGIS